jgi:hypothetical protein
VGFYHFNEQPETNSNQALVAIIIIISQAEKKEEKN